MKWKKKWSSDSESPFLGFKLIVCITNIWKSKSVCVYTSAHVHVWCASLFAVCLPTTLEKAFHSFFFTDWRGHALGIIPLANFFSWNFGNSIG